MSLEDIAELRAENARLRDALKPFADYAELLDEWNVPNDATVRYSPTFPGDNRPTAGDCRKARSAIEEPAFVNRLGRSVSSRAP